MSALNKLQQLRARSKISKKNSTIICIEITLCKYTDTPKNPQQENSHQKSIVSTDSTGNSNKNLQKLCAQQKIAQPEIRRNPHTSSIIKKSVNQSATQINWLVSIRWQINAEYWKTWKLMGTLVKNRSMKNFERSWNASDANTSLAIS